MNIPEPYVDEILMGDLRKLINTYYVSESQKNASLPPSTINTESSSFMSIQTSATTLSTPGIHFNCSDPLSTPGIHFIYISNIILLLDLRNDFNDFVEIFYLKDNIVQKNVSYPL